MFQMPNSEKIKMTLIGKLDARQIVRNAGMSDRPEYYSGRGAITSDLNDKILEKTYELVQKEHGDDAAKHFAQMVADIQKLSATDFLNTLYNLESRNWKWDKRLLGDGKGMDVGPDRGDRGREAIAMMTIAGVLFGASER